MAFNHQKNTEQFSKTLNHLANEDEDINSMTQTEIKIELMNINEVHC